MEQRNDAYLLHLIEALNNHINYTQTVSVRYKADLMAVAQEFLNTHRIPGSVEKVAQLELNEIEVLLNNLFQYKRSQNAYTKEFYNTNDSFNRILNNFKQYKKSYMDISQRILTRLTSVEQIHSIINQMKVIAKEIKLFSINSVIVASQAGKQGVGFKSISRFIIELSDTIQKSAIQLENYRDKILLVHENLKLQFDNLINGIYENKINDIQNKTQNSVIWAAEDIEVIMKTIIEMSTRIKKIIEAGNAKASPFLTGKNRIMEVYIIQNALSALNDMKPLKSKDIEGKEIFQLLAAIRAVEQLTSPFFTHALGIVAGYRTSLMSGYGDFLNVFGMAQQDQMYLFNYLITPNEKEDSLLNQIFEGIKNNISNFQLLLVEESKVKEALLDNFLEIEKINQEGLTIFSNFEKFFTTMNNINILAQIEISKNTFETFNNANLKSKFNVMLENIKNFNNDIKNHIKKMLANLMLEMDKFTDLQVEQNSLLRNTNIYLDTEIGNLDLSLLMLKKQIHAIRDENPKIYNMEVSLQKRLTKIDVATQDFVDKVAEIASILRKNLNKFNDIIQEHSLGNLDNYTTNNPLLEQFIVSHQAIIDEMSAKTADYNK